MEIERTKDFRYFEYGWQLGEEVEGKVKWGYGEMIVVYNMQVCRSKE